MVCFWLFNTFFLDEKSIQKNHDYGSVASKLSKKAIVKELAALRHPLLAPFFNGLLVAPPRYVGFGFCLQIKFRTYFVSYNLYKWIGLLAA